MFPSKTNDSNWIVSTLGWIVRPFAKAWARARVQDELMGMDDRLLADIGISRADIPSIASGSYVQTEMRVPRLVAEQVNRVRRPDAPLAHNDAAEPRVA
jgi:uncharacterized protein YjiS (DUF1127 family)